jgi:hypothetical protein
MDDHDDQDDREPGVRTDEEREHDLPPGADTRGHQEDIPGTAGRGTPYEDAPGEGHLAPASPDDPPPARPRVAREADRGDERNR